MSDPALYPPCCSQCGKRWIDQACGPTHAIVANEFGLDDLRLALLRLSDALTVEGRSPSYHRAQVRRLGDEWPTLTGAIENVLTDVGLPGKRTWRLTAGTLRSVWLKRDAAPTRCQADPETERMGQVSSPRRGRVGTPPPSGS